MWFVGSRFRSRSSTLGLVSDVVLVTTVARKVIRRRGRLRPAGTGPADLVEVGELVLATAAAIRLARHADRHFRRRRASAR
jgi:hypothetical protein